MLFATPGRWPSLISLSFQRVCGHSHQNFVLFPWWNLQVSSIHFSETGEGKDKSSYITCEGTNNFWCLSQYISIYMRWWRMHNMELYNSAKRPQKLFVWKELCQATKLCCSNTTLKNKYNCIICVWHGMEPEKHILEILVHLWRKVTFLGYHKFLPIVIVISGDCLILLSKVGFI